MTEIQPVRKLYLKQRPRNLEELIVTLLTNNESKSHFSALKSAATYYDKKCTQLQCSAYRYRSTDDIFDCARTYFPTVKIETILRTFSSLVIVCRNPRTGNVLHFVPYFSTCGTMKRQRMFYYASKVSAEIVYRSGITAMKHDSRIVFNKYLPRTFKTSEEFAKVFCKKEIRL